jgi:hypothetical protein
MANLSPTAAFGKKKTSTTRAMPDLDGANVTAPPTLVNQATPPPSSTHTGSVDPVTGATSTPHGAPPPAPPGSGGGGAGGAGGGVTAPAPVSTPTGGPIGPAPKVTPGTPTGMPDEVIIKEGVFDPREGDTSNDALDNALRELNISRIKGASNVDTTEAESLIRDLMQRQLGAQQVGQRASMGRAGFASSGALAGMESDAQQQAAQNAQREILGLRRSEDQRAFDNAQDAAGTDLDYRRWGTDDEVRRAQLKALQDFLNVDNGEGATEPQTGRLSEDGKSIVSDENAIANPEDIPVRSSKSPGSQPMGEMTGDDGKIYDIFYDTDKAEVYVVRRK